MEEFLAQNLDMILGFVVGLVAAMFFKIIAIIDALVAKSSNKVDDVFWAKLKEEVKKVIDTDKKE